MKKALLIIATLGFISFAFGANEFDSINNTITSMDTAGKSTIGVFGRWFLGLCPVILFVGVGWGAYRYASKKAEQEQDTSKIVISTLVGALLGAVIGVAFVALLGAGLMGDSSKGIQVMNAFWKTIFGV